MNNNKVILFCLPYAGGSAFTYYKWVPSLGKEIELYPLELAGRGKRFGEILNESLEDIIDDIYPLFKKKVQKNINYAIWGHSMGSLLAYLLSCKLYKEEGICANHLFLSGQVPLHYIEKEYHYKLSDEDFISYLKSLGGIKDIMLNNPEILEMFLPIIRADMRSINTYDREMVLKKTPFNISILYSDDDASVDCSVMAEWQTYTEKACSFYKFDGDHFFIDTFKDDVIEIIRSTLLSGLEKGEKGKRCTHYGSTDRPVGYQK